MKLMFQTMALKDLNQTLGCCFIMIVKAITNKETVLLKMFLSEKRVRKGAHETRAYPGFCSMK